LSVPGLVVSILGMDIGVLLPTGAAQWGANGDPRELIAFGRRAERLGFSSLFVNDSLISPRIEALTMLAALAPATETVTLGTGALLPFLRRPIQTAQSLASIDLLSGGRLTVTVGAGFPDPTAGTRGTNRPQQDPDGPNPSNRDQHPDRITESPTESWPHANGGTGSDNGGQMNTTRSRDASRPDMPGCRRQ